MLIDGERGKKRFMHGRLLVRRLFGSRYMHVVWVVRALHVFRFVVFISLVLVLVL
jgi:hypothetical protein